MSTNKVTVAKIAKYTGVSSATVSRVLNHRELVRPDTVELVQNAIKTLGYTPNRPVLPEAPASKGVIVFNIPGTENPFYHEIISGANTAVSAHGYYLLVSYCQIDSGTIENFCAMLKRVNACGVILSSLLPLNFLNRIDSVASVVQCCEYNKEAKYPFVAVDDFAAAKAATEYLIAAGRNKIGLINGPLSFKFARERRDGYLSALESAGLSVPSGWVVNLPEIDFDMAFSAICQILNNETIPNAFFTVSDVYAAAVIRSARRYSLNVPNDIMVIGFDNINISTMMCPSITTVNMPRQQLGFSAARMLLEIIDHPDMASKSLFLDTELIVRESTASVGIPYTRT